MKSDRVHKGIVKNALHVKILFRFRLQKKDSVFNVYLLAYQSFCWN
jgi:hypothetical protein